MPHVTDDQTEEESPGGSEPQELESVGTRRVITRRRALWVVSLAALIAVLAGADVAAEGGGQAGEDSVHCPVLVAREAVTQARAEAAEDIRDLDGRTGHGSLLVCRLKLRQTIKRAGCLLQQLR